MNKRVVFQGFISILCVLVVSTQVFAVKLPFKVDIGTPGQKVAPGFVEWSSDAEQQIELIDAGASGIDLKLRTGAENDSGFRNHNGDVLLDDFLHPDNHDGHFEGRIILTISKLPAGSYKLVSWHKQELNDIDVTVEGAVLRSKPYIGTRDGDKDSKVSTITFLASGTGDVVVSYSPKDYSAGKAFLSGFELSQGEPTVMFDPVTSGNLESVSPVNLNVVLYSGPADSEVTVKYRVTGGTAVGGGVDYTLEPGTLKFAPGQMRQQINVNVVDDGLPENDETIIVTLSEPTGPNTVLGPQSERTYTIVDPRPSVGFVNANSGGFESKATRSIAVRLEDPFGWPLQYHSDTIVVDCDVSGGSATQGSDFVKKTRSLEFAPGQLRKNVVISLPDDEKCEGDETVELKLTNPSSNAKVAANADHTLTIYDDELGGQIYTNPIGMKFHRIPQVTFEMGGGDDPRFDHAYDELPAHDVTISKDFYICETEVTADQYRKFDENYVGDGPVTGLDWNEAMAFCRWLSRQQKGFNYSLPTEAQWEYVCKFVSDVRNMDVTPKEWVRDWHGCFLPDYQIDPLGPPVGTTRVIRTNASDREALPADAGIASGFENISFRVVVTTDPAKGNFVHSIPFPQEGIKKNFASVLQAPDPAVPYFNRRFAMPIPPENTSGGELVGVNGSVGTHNHSPGFVAMDNGDILAVYFSCINDESDDNTTFVQARLRFGSNQWDMPDYFLDLADWNDQSGLLWNDKGKIWFFGGGRGISDYVPFKILVSTDNGATWKASLPRFDKKPRGNTPQPITNAFRSPAGDIYFAMDGGGARSFLWRSSDEGVTWHDMGARTSGRHSTIIPLDDKGNLLSLGGKNSDIDGMMPMNTSNDWGATWSDEVATIFPSLGTNQRPHVIRLASGKLFFISDSKMRDNPERKIWSSDEPFVAISEDNGRNWHIKTLPDTLTHEDGTNRTLGYMTATQSPNGLIHILSTMTHPCVHYVLNEAWIYSDALGGAVADPGEAGRVEQYVEKYPDGKIKAKWSAKITDNSRYLLHGKENWFYSDGQKQYSANFHNGDIVGEETYWLPDGTKNWSWYYDAKNQTAVWTQYWANGYKRLESHWKTSWQTQGMTFSGKVAHGPAYQWNQQGKPLEGWNFVDGVKKEALEPPSQKK